MKIIKFNTKVLALFALLLSSNAFAQPHLSGEVGGVIVTTENTCVSENECVEKEPFINLYAGYIFDHLRLNGIISQTSDGKVDLTLGMISLDYSPWSVSIGRPGINLGLNPSSMAGFITPPSEPIISSTFVRRWRRTLVIPDYGISSSYKTGTINFTYSYYIENRITREEAEELDMSSNSVLIDGVPTSENIDQQGPINNLLDITTVTSEVDEILFEPMRNRGDNITPRPSKKRFDVSVNNFRADILTENGIYGVDYIQADVDVIPVNVLALWGIVNIDKWNLNFEHISIDNVTKFNTVSVNYTLNNFVPFVLHSNIYGKIKGREDTVGLLWNVTDDISLRGAYHEFTGPTFLLNAKEDDVSAFTFTLGYQFHLF